MYVRRCRSHPMLFIYSVLDEGWCGPTPSATETLIAYMLYKVTGGSARFLAYQARAVCMYWSATRT